MAWITALLAFASVTAAPLALLYGAAYFGEWSGFVLFILALAAGAWLTGRALLRYRFPPAALLALQTLGFILSADHINQLF